SRLAQYEIEVESPLRPKEIQDRIRAGETAEEIADAAGVPIERVRRVEGPGGAERADPGPEGPRASVPAPRGPPRRRRVGARRGAGRGRRLGEVLAERFSDLGADMEEAQWDSRKRADGSWQVSLVFTAGGHPRLAEWVFDPRNRHVSPADDTAAGLCLPDA